jgi:CheY-like chemotaxis protein
MERRLFLFEWNARAAGERAAALGAAGWTVEVECEDGARGVRRVLDLQPAMVVLDLARRPSHSRECAAALRKYRATRRLPLVFVDGTPEEQSRTAAKVRDAIFIGSEMLLTRLASMDA